MRRHPVGQEIPRFAIRVRNWAPPTFGLLLFALILWRLDLGLLMGTVANVDLVLVVAAALLLVINLLIQAWRWHFLVRAQRIEYGLLDSIIMYWAGQAAGMLTPGRLGDLVKVLYIRKDGHSTGKSLVSVVLDRLFDVAFLVSVGLIGALLIWGVPANPLWWIAPGGAGILAAAVLIVYSGRPALAAGRLVAALIPRTLRDTLRVNAEDFITGLRVLQPSIYWVASLTTVVAWVLRFWTCYLIALSLGIHIPPFYLSISMALASVAAMLPISILGIGPREAVIVVAFSGLGIGSEFAVGFSVLNLGITSIVVSLGALTLIRRPL